MAVNTLIKVKFIISIIFIGISLIANPSIAAEFSANVSQKISNPRTGITNISAKLYIKGIIRRHEINMQNGKSITIERPDKGLMWIITPSTKSYIELKTIKVEEKTIRSMESIIKQRPNVKFMGTEKVSGYMCNKYKFTDKVNHASSTWWISPELQQEVKSISKSTNGTITVLLTNIKEAKQPDSLFTVPKGYKKLPTPKHGMNGIAPGGNGMHTIPPKK